MTKPTIGVDISKGPLDACRWPGGETCRVSNDAAGHRRLLRWIGAEVARASEPAGVKPASVSDRAERVRDALSATSATGDVVPGLAWGNGWYNWPNGWHNWRNGWNNWSNLWNNGWNNWNNWNNSWYNF